MYFGRIPTTADFDSVNYLVPFTFIAHNTQYNLPFSYTRDYTESSTQVGAPSGRMLQDVINIIRFDFRHLGYYSSNNSNSISFDNMGVLLSRILSEFNLVFTPLQTANAPQNFSNIKLSNGVVLNADYGPGKLTSGAMIITANSPIKCSFNIQTFDNDRCFFRLDLFTIPYNSISDDGFDTDLINEGARDIIVTSNGELTAQGQITWNDLNVRIQKSSTVSSFIDLIDVINDNWSEISDDIDYDVESLNPYDTGLPSNIGGGDGGYINPDDSVKVEFPDLPEIDAVTTGLLTIFNPSLLQVNALGDYLWSNAFDVDTLKKLFGDPMDAIIGLSIVPVKPPLAGSKTVKIGNVSTEVSMPYCSRQFVEKNIGSIAIKKYVGSFMDYAPYTKIQIYLPYIGVRDLNPDDVMGETITVKYHIDILTGGCAAMISVGSKGVMYQYNGSCIANVPLTAINYSGAIQNAVSAIGSGITAVVGMATGAAPLTGVGVAGLATSAANTALSSKPTIQRSGSMGGSSGLMSVQQCYLIVTRPRMSVPANLNRFGGYPANINAKLSTLTGLTMIDAIRLDNIPATENEKQELLALLQKGVIF